MSSQSLDPAPRDAFRIDSSLQFFNEGQNALSIPQHLPIKKPAFIPGIGMGLVAIEDLMET
jgi:hypothetical protein